MTSTDVCWHQCYYGGINQLFADIFKIYCYSHVINRLHLANAPIRALGMSDIFAGHQVGASG